MESAFVDDFVVILAPILGFSPCILPFYPRKLSGDEFGSDWHPQACSRSLLCVETWLEISMCDAACLSLTAGGIRSRKNRRAGRDIGAAAWKAARLASGRSRRINEKIAIAPPDAVTPMSVLQIVNGLKSSVARGTHAAAISPKVTYVRDMR
jgi:hypothetical protein